MEETKKCVDCGKELPLSQFSRNRAGVLSMCKKCQGERHKKGLREKHQRKWGGVKYSDPEFDGKTPREVMDVLSRAAKWLNSYGGYTCNISLRYEKEIKLPID